MIHVIATIQLAPGTRGVWCSLASPTMLGTIARSSADWVALDVQHGEFDRHALVEAGRTLTAAGHPFAVRVAGLDPAGIGLALDVGAATVIVPSSGLPSVRRCTGGSMPWSMALRSRCVSGASRRSSTSRSTASCSPRSTTCALRPRRRARSRTMRG